jgi:hypothetical protein
MNTKVVIFAAPSQTHHKLLQAHNEQGTLEANIGSFLCSPAPNRVQ